MTHLLAHDADAAYVRRLAHEWHLPEADAVQRIVRAYGWNRENAPEIAHRYQNSHGGRIRMKGD